MTDLDDRQSRVGGKEPDTLIVSDSKSTLYT